MNATTAGRIRLDKNFVGHDPMTNNILPGMTVMADIITGEKTILGLSPQTYSTVD